MTDILVVGANGRLGRALLQQASLLPGVTVAGLPRSALDVTDADAVDSAFEQYRPAVVINAAAYTDVTAAQTQPERAYAVNALAPGYLAGAARRYQAQLVHYSTDYVFSGHGSRAWTENCEPSPVGVYGKSKAAGEAAVRREGAAGVIIRAGWLHSGERDFVQAILLRALRGESLAVVDDQIGTPTETAALARWTLEQLGGLDRSTMQCWHYREQGPYVSRWAMADYLLASAQRCLDGAGKAMLAGRCVQARREMKKTVMTDPTRPKNCRLANERSPRTTVDWHEGVDASVKEVLKGYKA